VTKKGRPVEGSVNSLLKAVWQANNRSKRISLSKGHRNNWKEFDMARSNRHMWEEGEEDWFGKTLRLRNMGLYLPSKTCTVTRAEGKKEKKSYSLNNEIFYPTILCELCDNEEVCDLFHLHVCPALKEVNKGRDEAFSDICKEMTGVDMHPYFWSEKTELEARGQKITTKRYVPKLCICNTGKHGEYACCHDCFGVFHPTCLGISATVEELNKGEPF
jgi:hypothetical protein